MEIKGLTGVIKFDNQGFRSSFSLDIVELGKEGLRKIGTWNASEGVNLTRTFGEVYKQVVESLHNKTFIVTTILVCDLFVAKRVGTGMQYLLGRIMTTTYLFPLPVLELSLLYDQEF